MTLAEFRDRLLASAHRLEWTAREEPNYVARSFQNRDDDISPLKAGEAVGLQLGSYPVIAALIRLENPESLNASLKRFHGQMVIARSFMMASEIVNAHILLCAHESGDGDWSAVKDIAERDEAVCRKLVWIPDANDLEPSWALFRDRTFLAEPWAEKAVITTADLDHNEGLVQRVLRECGLAPDTAKAWEGLARAHQDEPDILVAKLVDLMEAKA